MKELREAAYVAGNGHDMQIDGDREVSDGKVPCRWVDDDPESDSYGDVQNGEFDPEDLVPQKSSKLPDKE